MRKLPLVGLMILVLLPTTGYFGGMYHLDQLRPPIHKDIAKSLEQTKEERKKQNPITIGQFMGKPYNQAMLSEVLQKMANEGTDLDLYLVWGNAWACNWTRHENQFKGIGLDPEDAIANAISQYLGKDQQ